MKNIYYITGAFGCGKTTITKKLKSKTTYSLIEDDSLLFLLKNPNFQIRNLSYLTIMYYRIHKAIQKQQYDTLMVDGHPFHSWIYTQAAFELQNVLTVTEKDLEEVTLITDKLKEITKEMYKKVTQTIIFIDLPLDENWNRVEQRLKTRREDFPEELDITYLKTVRRIFKSNINYLAELHECDLITVNSTDEILKLQL